MTPENSIPISRITHSLFFFRLICVVSVLLLNIAAVRGQNITVSSASGSIFTCIGSPSESPSIQSFTLSANGLIGTLIVIAPLGFQVSLSSGTGFQDAIDLTPNAGILPTTILYVRATGNRAGNISGNVVLVSGSTSKTVAVAATVYDLPVITQKVDITVEADTQTEPMVFFTQGTMSYNWTNSNPAIGLAANGNGNIPSFTAVNSTSNSINGTVRATATSTGYAYIPNDSRQLSIVNTSTYLREGIISIGDNAYGVTITPDGRYVYVSNNGSDNVSVIDTRTNTVTTTVAVGSGPTGLVANPAGTRVYVVNHNSNTVSVINTNLNTIIATIPVGTLPNAVAISPNGARLYVSNSSDNVSVINTSTNTVVATIAVGSIPEGIIVSPDGNRLYVANNGLFSNTVSVINTSTNSVINTITVGNNPFGLAIHDNTLYVTNQNSNSVSVINTLTGAVTNTLPTGEFPYGISLSSDGYKLFVVSKFDSNVTVIDTQTNAEISSIDVGSLPTSLGNFVSASTGCTGPAMEFKIIVSPKVVLPPTLDVTAAMGTILSCVNMPSADPDLQSFIFSAKNIITPVSLTASSDFQISIAPGSGFSTSLLLPQGGGNILDQKIYVRLGTVSSSGNFNGNITVSVDGLSKSISVAAVVRNPSTVDALPNVEFANGAPTTSFSFTGTSAKYIWTNSNPSIGLAASGDQKISSFTATNTGSVPAVATITVTPVAGEYLYVPDWGGGRVMVIDVDRAQQVGVVATQSGPFAIVINPQGNRAYVTNVNSRTVSVIDTRSNTLITALPVECTGSVTISIDGTRLFVAGPKKIFVIDVTTNTVIREVDTRSDDLLVGIAVHPNGNTLYAENKFTNTVSVIDQASNTITHTIATGSSPEQMIISPDGTRLYVANRNGRSVTVINTFTNQVVTTISDVGVSNGIITNSNGTRIYVAVNGGVTEIDAATNTILKKFDHGWAYGVSVSKDNRTLYYARQDALVIVDIETGTMKSTVWGFSQALPMGNFVVSGTGCPGASTSFNITVPATKIQTTQATGTIKACSGDASANPNLQQFNITASRLSSNLTLEAPQHFEISTSPSGTFSNQIILSPISGNVTATIYVRSAAAAPIGSLFGKIILTTAGSPAHYVKVIGAVNPNPTMDVLNNIVLEGGVTSSPIEFTTQNGSQDYQWTNTTPSIGLPASGTGIVPEFLPENTGNSPIVATVSVTPVSIPFVYMPMGNYVLLWNTMTPSSGRFVKLTGSHAGVAVSPDGNHGYITARNKGYVYILSTGKKMVEDSIPVGNEPYGVAVRNDGKFLYVANNKSSSVSIIDLTTRLVVRTVNIVNSQPASIAVNPAGTRLYVSDTQSSRLSVIDLQSFNEIASVPISGATGLAVSPDGERIYATGFGSSDVTVIDATLNRVITSIGIGHSAWGITITPDGRYVYTSVRDQNRVVVIDAATNESIRFIDLAYNPYSISASPDGSAVYVNSAMDGGTYEINTTTFVARNLNSLNNASNAIGNFVTRGGGCVATPKTFTITVNPNTGPVIIASTISDLVTSCVGNPSTTSQYIMVSGIHMEGPLMATAPNYFEISTSSTGGFGPTLSIAPSGSVLPETKIYIRLKAIDQLIYTETLFFLTSLNATTKEISVYGKVNGSPFLVSQTIPNATVGGFYSYSTTQSAEGHTFSAIGLPVGLSIHATSGIISGTPTTTTTTPAEIVVTANGLCGGSATYTLSVNGSATSATVVISNTTQTFNGDPLPVTVTTIPAGLPVTITYNGSSSIPVNTGTYGVVATINSPSYTGTTSASHTITKATATINLSNTVYTYDASPRAVTVTTVPFGIPFTITYNNSAQLPTDAGTYTVHVTIDNLNFDGERVDQLIIGRANLDITAENKLRIYSEANPLLTYHYSGFAGNEDERVLSSLPTITTTATTLSLAGEYPITIIGGDAKNYLIRRIPGILSIVKLEQQISFEIIDDKLINEGPITLFASATSGLPVYFTLINGAATLRGSTLSFTGGGEITVAAQQDGDQKYISAYTEQTFNVGVPVDIELPVETSVRVYPNPSSGQLYFVLPKLALMGNVMLLDSKGNLIIETKVDEKEGMDVSGMAPGIYILLLEYNGTTIVKKVTIK